MPVVVAVGVDALESFPPAPATLPPWPLIAWKDVTSGARFVSEAWVRVLVVEEEVSLAFFLPVVAAEEEYSKSISWSSA